MQHRGLSHGMITAYLSWSFVYAWSFATPSSTATFTSTTAKSHAHQAL